LNNSVMPYLFGPDQVSFTNALNTGRIRAIVLAFFSIPVHSIIRTPQCHATKRPMVARDMCVTHGSHAQPLGHRAKLCRQNGRSVFFCRLTPRRRKPSHANTGRRMGKIAHGWAEHATVLMLWRLRLCASERCPFPPAAHDCAVPAASVALPAHPAASLCSFS